MSIYEYDCSEVWATIMGHHGCVMSASRGSTAVNMSIYEYD